MNKMVISCLLLFIAVTVMAEPPPEIEWEKLYPVHFSDVRETLKGNLICAGWEIETGNLNCVFCLNAEGYVIWEYNDQTYPRIYWTDCLQQLSDGSIVTVGTGYQTSPSSLPALAICKLTQEGNEVWTKVYELTEGNSRGYNFTPLPDGGFAICGDIDPIEGMNQAWILRTDSQGDTLWTREWGWDYNDKAMKVLYIDNGLTVLTHGRLQTTTGGPHLVRYDMDGNLLWETDIPELEGEFAQDMCEAYDGGLFILDSYVPSITHTDLYGNYEWHFGPPGWGQNYGWSIDTTMDGGIIFGGENA